MQDNSNSLLIDFSADRCEDKGLKTKSDSREGCVYPCKAGAVQDEGTKAISHVCGQVISLGKQSVWVICCMLAIRLSRLKSQYSSCVSEHPKKDIEDQGILSIFAFGAGMVGVK